MPYLGSREKEVKSNDAKVDAIVGRGLTRGGRYRVTHSTKCQFDVVWGQQVCDWHV